MLISRSLFLDSKSFLGREQARGVHIIPKLRSLEIGEHSIFSAIGKEYY